jgi:hypothetical protein
LVVVNPMMRAIWIAMVLGLLLLLLLAAHMPG